MAPLLLARMPVFAIAAQNENSKLASNFSGGKLGISNPQKGVIPPAPALDLAFVLRPGKDAPVPSNRLGFS